MFFILSHFVNQIDICSDQILKSLGAFISNVLDHLLVLRVVIVLLKDFILEVVLILFLIGVELEVEIRQFAIFLDYLFEDTS